MPLIQVGAPKGAMSKEKQDVFMKKLSDNVIKSEGATIGDAGANSSVWAYYDEIDASSCYLGGVVVVKQPLYIKVTTPKGAISKENRKILSEEVQEMVNEAIGAFEGRLNYWLIFMEADGDVWGADGDLFSLDQIKQVMNIDK